MAVIIQIFLIFFSLFEALSRPHRSRQLSVNTARSQAKYKESLSQKRKYIKANGITVEYTERPKKKSNKLIKTLLPKRKLAPQEEEETIEEDNDIINVQGVDRCDHGHTPDYLGDCTRYQEEERSCCMFQYGRDVGCIFLPFRYLGSYQVGDMRVQCLSKFIKSKLIYIVLLFFIS